VINVRNVDWSQETLNTPDFELPKSAGANGRYGFSCSISADGKTALVAGQSSSSSGSAWVWVGDDLGPRVTLNYDGTEA
jgi:hypothetical protein